ncbi:Zn(II)2Cys6 transcription factor domain-containing protein [Aspergillus undulatus]|uniref:Zn(II)2Cys6 transcription factor domain-containing protein n=1 Tax=Aspergillus undulatus TaxID=1810928 RepID=UPI003CCD4BFF
MDRPAPRPRASKPKVRTGCITCKTRKVKCDEGKPACRRCVSTGRKCDGYAQRSAGTPQEPSLCTIAVSIEESRALEFFFHTTSHQLAGFLERGFWTRSVLQLSLSEPSIRLALAALGSLHEHEASQQMSTTAVADQLYSRAMRCTMDKAAAGETAVPIVAMASILFTSFEFLRGNSVAAATHIASGIKLVQNSRQNSPTTANGGWGRKYSTYEAQFLETELAPILTLFSLNASEFTPFPPRRLILTGVDGGSPKLPERFETLREARVVLVDLVTASAGLFQRLDAHIAGEEPLSIDPMDASEGLRTGFDMWKVKFQELVDRRKLTWSKEEKGAANVIRNMQYGSEIGLAAYLVSCECDWDSRRQEYEQILDLAETIVAEARYNLDGSSNPLSLESSLIYPMHAVAWKCRYPDIRRRGLDLLLKSPRREWLLDARQYHAIFSRIMAIEERADSLDHFTDCGLRDDVLSPEHVRVHDFSCMPDPGIADDKTRYAVTFMTKPDGPDGPWHFTTEHMSLPTSGFGDMAPSNLISPRRWARPDTTEPLTSNMLKSAVFGPYLTQNF